jgi:hypothetical protein
MSSENRPKQDGGGRFVKGRSGNPGGRPKLVGHVRELAQEHTDVAVLTLVEIVSDKTAPPAARVSAATSLLDRGWGKASQPIGGADDLPPIRSTREMSEAELLAIAAGKVHD